MHTADACIMTFPCFGSPDPKTCCHKRNLRSQFKRVWSHIWINTGEYSPPVHFHSMQAKRQKHGVPQMDYKLKRWYPRSSHPVLPTYRLSRRWSFTCIHSRVCDSNPIQEHRNSASQWGKRWMHIKTSESLCSPARHHPDVAIDLWRWTSCRSKTGLKVISQHCNWIQRVLFQI